MNVSFKTMGAGDVFLRIQNLFLSYSSVSRQGSNFDLVMIHESKSTKNQTNKTKVFFFTILTGSY